MKSIEDRRFVAGSEDCGADIPNAEEVAFVNSVYSSVDEATACGLERLRSEEGIVPSCKKGCCHCCRYHILTNIAEAHTLGEYVRREFSPDEIIDLRTRTKRWHEWDNSRPGRHPGDNSEEETDLSGYVPCCPLLVDGKCRAYPVRPVVCRTHFVCSNAMCCCAANDPESTEAVPVVLSSLVSDTRSLSMAIRTHIEDSGLEFSRSIMLLPHWLAVEMEWDFAVLP